MCHRHAVDSVAINGSFYHFAGPPLAAQKRRRRVHATSVNESADHSLQPGTRTEKSRRAEAAHTLKSLCAARTVPSLDQVQEGCRAFTNIVPSGQKSGRVTRRERACSCIQLHASRSNSDPFSLMTSLAVKRLRLFQVIAGR